VVRGAFLARIWIGEYIGNFAQLHQVLRISFEALTLAAQFIARKADLVLRLEEERHPDTLAEKVWAQ
jgi:hypothetical protein